MRGAGRAALVVLALGLPACKRTPPPALPAPSAAIDAAPPTAAAPAAAPTLLRFEGDVRWTKDGESGPVVAGAIPAGAELATGAGGRATIRLPDGRELELKPNARVKLSTRPGPAGNPVTVEVMSGALVSRTPARGASTVELDILTPFGVTRVPAGEGEATIEVEMGRVSIEVAVGAISFVDRGGRTVSAGPAQAIEVSMGGVQILRGGKNGKNGKNAPVAAGTESAGSPKEGEDGEPGDDPDDGERVARVGRALRGDGDVALPTQRGLRVFGDRLRKITLTWPAQSGPVDIEVASDSRFKKVVFADRLEGERVTLAAPRRGSLYWRVRPAGDDKARAHTGQARFYPDRRRSLLDLKNPHNLVADTGEKATVYFQSALPALTFSFASHPKARAYRVRVFTATDLKNAVAERKVDEPRCTLPPGTLKEGSYLWHATPLDGAGRDLQGGRMNKLDLVYDNSLSTLAIASPKPGQTVSGSRVEVAGVAPLGSKLFVNGQPAPLDEKGRFEMQVDKAQALIFRLVGKGGAESYWVRTLRKRS